ncbi:MAG: FAD-dependent oxidoreductase [Mycobacteriales bacterium]
MQLLVVGNGMVGQRFVELLAARDPDRRWRITVLGEEPHPAYDRTALSSLIDSPSVDIALAGPGGDDGTHRVPRIGDPVVRIDRLRRRVHTAAGFTARYDALVLATGATPLVPPVPGAGLPHCFTYHTYDDLCRLRTRLADQPGRRAGVVVGGGLRGLEVARVLRRLGVDTTIVESGPWLMPRQVDEGGGQALRRRVEARGYTVLTGTAVRAVEPGAVRLANGRRLDADVVVFAAGTRPRDELARDCGLPVGGRGGVVVNGACRTADPAIWAIGDCTRIDWARTGGIAPGYAMAEVVADRLTGGDTTFTNPATAATLRMQDVDAVSFGDAHATTPGALEIVYADPVSGVYKKLVVTDDAQRLLGGILVGDASAYKTLRPLVGASLPAPPEQLLTPTGRAPVAVPGAAAVCGCRDVSRDALCAAIDTRGLTDLAGLRARTGAGSACGSCLPLVRSMLETRLAAAGLPVPGALCEHFRYGRAELADLVRAHGIRTYSALLARYGTRSGGRRGRDCALCVPVVAGLLWRTWSTQRRVDPATARRVPAVRGRDPAGVGAC